MAQTLPEQVFIGTSILHNSSQEAGRIIQGTLAKPEGANERDIHYALTLGPARLLEKPHQRTMARIQKKFRLGTLLDVQVTRNEQGQPVKITL